MGDAGHKNIHGLDRRIPPHVKLQVRQECGFGCVICGAAICQYEHFAPEFADAKEHLAQGIALLCGSCHDKVTRTFWPKKKVAEARSNPKTFALGFSREALHIGHDFALKLGSTIYRKVRHIVSTSSGQHWLSMEPPEQIGAPCQLSAEFRNASGLTVLKIERNELVVPAFNWDVEFEGPRLTIRNASREIALALRTDEDILEVERLAMVALGVSVEVRDGKVSMKIGGKLHSGPSLHMIGGEIVGAETILMLNGI